MTELLEKLPSSSFARIHKSFVIALDKIETIEKHDVFIGGTEIPIGASYKKAFLQKINYLGS